jgi:hypothetical protein
VFFGRASWFGRSCYERILTPGVGQLRGHVELSSEKNAPFCIMVGMGDWRLEIGYWILEIGDRWAVGGGRWAVGGGRWSVVGGRWSVVGGRWAVGGGR